MNQPLHDLDTGQEHFRQSDETSLAPRCLYADLCALEQLQLAYVYIKENPGQLCIDPLAIEIIEAEGVEAFLKQLHDHLQARTYQPPQVAECGGRGALRDLVVQATLMLHLESIFSPPAPSDPEPEKTIKWLVSNINRGFYRTYAVTLNECLDAGGRERLIERASRRIGDPLVITLLRKILAAPEQPGKNPQVLLVPLLNEIAFDSIDQILQQARALGREEKILHIQYARVANQLIVLSDHDPRYDWILPAVQKRLREELSNLHYDPSVIEAQSLDLLCGHRLSFLGFELCLVKDRHGDARVCYRCTEKAEPLQTNKPPSHLLGRHHSLRFAQPGLNWIARKLDWQILKRAYRKANAIQVGWHHLSITMFPILMLLFGWRSAAPWSDLALVFACNWRWTHNIVEWSRRHKLDVAMGMCAVGVLICSVFLLSDLYANRSREVAAAASLPPGFYLGEHHGNSWSNSEPTAGVSYGLYVPPHLEVQKGPFPLIVYLHNYSEGTKTRIFKSGLALAIANQIGSNGGNGRFPFVAFFPIDPTGRWQAGSAEVESVMMALDYVIGRHRIDPARVYVTGISAGGSGVWSLAEAYPDKWAAVAPVCSFISPDVVKVRNLSAWIFHGAKDQRAPAEQDRILAQHLKEFGADVRYTELPNKEREIWQEVYKPEALYSWLASKKKD